MTEQTHNLHLPFIMPSQAQKHITHNEALQVLDGIMHLSVESREVSSPPADILDGMRFLIPDLSQGIWEEQANKLAYFDGHTWIYYEPRPGWICHVVDENIMIFYDGQSWQPLQASQSNAEQIQLLGINAPANEAERLVVSTNKSLFSHEGSDHKLYVNKASENDIASIIFQSDYAGHAELGLTGTNDLSIKLSADGLTWTNAMVFDKEHALAKTPNKPYFRAVPNASHPTQSHALPLKFDALVKQTGNGFDSASSQYTVPLTGLYSFSVNARFDAMPEGGYARLFFTRNNSAENFTLGHCISGNNHSTDFHSMSLNSILHLEEGDVVSVHGGHASGQGYLQQESTWTGVWIG